MRRYKKRKNYMYLGEIASACHVHVRTVKRLILSGKVCSPKARYLLLLGGKYHSAVDHAAGVKLLSHLGTSA